VVGYEEKAAGCGVMDMAGYWSYIIVRMLGSDGKTWGFSREPKGDLSGMQCITSHIHLSCGGASGEHGESRSKGSIPA